MNKYLLIPVLTAVLMGCGEDKAAAEAAAEKGKLEKEAAVEYVKQVQKLQKAVGDAEQMEGMYISELDQVPKQYLKGVPFAPRGLLEDEWKYDPDTKKVYVIHKVSDVNEESFTDSICRRIRNEGKNTVTCVKYSSKVPPSESMIKADKKVKSGDMAIIFSAN